MANNSFLQFNREQWSSFRKNTNINITNEDLKPLLGFNENLDLEEINTIYLPLVRLLNYYVESHQEKLKVMQTFLELSDENIKPTPFIISIAGAVSVGKSTVSRLLKFLLENWPKKRKVDVVTTDGFLYPLDYLVKNNLLNRKGFPESYDISKLISFISDVKNGKEAYSNIYSHLTYDIIKDQQIKVHNPDILILEGLNVLHAGNSNNNLVIFDFVDFGIYVDAPIHLLESWYIDRFLNFRKRFFTNPESYFKHYANVSEEEAIKFAKDIWKNINEKNLIENILPTKERASLVLTKGVSHKIELISLKK